MITELINKTFAKTAMGVIAVAMCVTACSSDSDDWTPGPKPTSNTVVYFIDKNNASLELDRGEAGDFKVCMCRTDSVGEVTVPITVKANSANFDIPSSVTFPDGKDTVEVNVKYKGGDPTGNYSCLLSITDPNYVNDYTSLDVAYYLGVSVTNWTLVSDEVTVKPQYKVIPDYTCKLYQNEGTTQYKLKGFMENYDLVFDTKTKEEVQPTTSGYLGDVLYIYPLNCTYGKEYYGDDACFLTKDGNYFAIYAHGITDSYFYYTFLYVGGNNNWGTSFINPTTKTGSLGIYMERYNLDTNEYVYGNGYDYLNFSWK